MSSLLKTTLNTRALPIGEMKYIRSDCPARLTDDEVKWLLDNDVTTVVDLREKFECEATPCRLENEAGFIYYHFPVSFGGIVPRNPEDVAGSYVRMIDDNMDKIIETIMNAQDKVLYFCAGGKDRTGVVSAIILKKLGIDDNIIIDDYMKTGENLFYLLNDMAKKHPEINPDVIFPKEENIKSVLSAINGK